MLLRRFMQEPMIAPVEAGGSQRYLLYDDLGSVIAATGIRAR